MTFVAFTSAECDSGSPGDETLVQKIRTNFDDHESRITTLESAFDIRLASHFARFPCYQSATPGDPDGIIFDAGDTTVADKYYEGAFYIVGKRSKVTNEAALSGAADNHYIKRVTGTGGTGAQSEFGLFGHPVIYFDNRTKPIRHTMRIKLTNHSSWGGYYVGLQEVPDTTVGIARPGNGIFLERSSSTQVRFVSVNGGVATVGTAFNVPADSTWWEVDIEFTNTPGNQANCYTKDAAGASTLRETLTTNLPTAKVLLGGGWWRTAGANVSEVHVDSYLLRSAGALSNAA
jgi:hypothetical protein